MMLRIGRLISSLLAVAGKESIWIPGGRFLSLLAGVVAIRALTELVPPDEYGRLALVTGLINLFSLTFYTSLGKSATRYIWDYVNDKRGAIWVLSVILAVCGLGIVFTVLLWGALAFGVDVNLDPLIAVWTIPIFLIAGSLATLLLGMLNILQEHRVFVLGTVIYAWLRPGLAILAVLVFLPTAEMVLVGYASSALLVAMGVLWVTQQRSLLKLPPQKLKIMPILKQMGVYAMPFVFVSFFYWIQITSNRFVLDINLGIDQVGVFVVAATVGRLPIQSIESIFGQVHQPRLYKKIGQHDGQDVDEYVRQKAFSDYVLSFLIITLPILWLTIFASDVLIRLFAGQSYWVGVTVIPWIALAEFLRALIATISMAFEIEQQPRSLVFPIVVSSIITLALTYFLSLSLGIIGAGIALTMGTCAWLLFIIFPASRLDCWSIPWSSVLKAIIASIMIGLIANLARQLGTNVGLWGESILLGLAFGIVYIMHAGRRLLDIHE